MNKLNKTSETGVVYAKTGQKARGKVQAYHRKPDPILLNITEHEYDIETISAKKRKEVLCFNERYEYTTNTYVKEAKSRFTIGFEVEKVRLSRGAVKEYELFAGFETDSSCGYEAVTHILPLVPSGRWRTKVFDMMLKAEKIIDNQWSASDVNCGGHINLGVYGYSGGAILQKVRPFMGLIYALFRYRLRNNYCKYNPRLRPKIELRSIDTDFTYLNHPKYHTVLAKDRIIEIRLPSRVESVKQLMRRYELMYELLDIAFNTKTKSIKPLLKRARPILSRMYDTTFEVDNICDLAEKFQRYINRGVIDPSIASLLPPQTY